MLSGAPGNRAVVSLLLSRLREPGGPETPAGGTALGLCDPGQVPPPSPSASRLSGYYSRQEGCNPWPSIALAGDDWNLLQQPCQAPELSQVLGGHLEASKSDSTICMGESEAQDVAGSPGGTQDWAVWACPMPTLQEGPLFGKSPDLVSLCCSPGRLLGCTSRIGVHSGVGVHCAESECYAQLGKPLETTPGLGPRAQLQRQTGYRVPGHGGGQWPGEEMCPDPFMDVEPIRDLFQYNFQKNKGRKSQAPHVLHIVGFWNTG